MLGKVLVLGLLIATVAGLSAPAWSEEKPAAAGPAPTSQEDKKKLNPDLLNLPANTWVKIAPNRNPEGRSFSGICWGNGVIYYFGGYHGSYTCNDVELYDVAANTWTQATEPEDWRDCDKWTYLTPEQTKLVKDNARGTNYPGILSPKGRPLTCHTYQQHVWFPEERAFYNMLVRLGLWAFDPATKEWREVTKQLPEIKDLSGAGLYYDPGLKTVFAICAGGGNSGAYAFDLEKKSWTLKCKLPSTAWSEVHAAYDSVRKVHVVHTQHKWYDLDLAAGTFNPIKGPDEVIKAANKYPPGPKGFQELRECPLAYDPQAKATMFVTKKNGHDNSVPVDLWAYDAEKGDWAEVKMNGAAPTGIVWWGLLVYDPDHKCCLLLNLLGIQGSARWGGPINGLFAFRYRRPEAQRSLVDHEGTGSAGLD
jgi:hypothetical protein